jgi:hypothetical protein
MAEGGTARNAVLDHQRNGTREEHLMSTQVYLQNNTAFDFDVSTTVSPAISSGDWTVMSGSAPAGANTFLYWTYRGQGITSGVTFTFNSNVTHGSGAEAALVDLQMKLVGNTTWSSLAAGFKGEAGSSSAFDSPWYPDPGPPGTGYPAQNITWPQDNGWYTLSLTFPSHSSATNPTDNVQYVLNYAANG